MPERYHFIGIGGAGMSVVAELLAVRGHEVSGSDRQDSAVLARLREAGITTWTGHDGARLAAFAPDTRVVISTAVRESNPELAAARRRGLEVLHRSEALARAAEGRDLVAVAGAHGKTSTSALLAVALDAAGQDPSYAIGGTVLGRGTGAHLGAGRVFVAEADESDRSFLNYRPHLALVTNVEPDHLDQFGTAEAYREAFEEFAARLLPGGVLVACADDAGSLALARRARAERVVTYGTAAEGLPGRPHVQLTAGPAAPGRGAGRLRRTGAGGEAPVEAGLELRVPGAHMLLNAAGAWAAGVELGVDPRELARALSAFTGTGRRFEDRGSAGGVRVVDDYAHNPTKVAAALATARQEAGPGRVVVLFQPHLYSRTQAFADRFAAALAAADEVIVTAVYGAREDPLPGVDATLITGQLPATRSGSPARHVADRHEAAALAADLARPGDLVLTLGAGDVTELPPVILDRLGGAAAGERREEGAS